MEAKKVTAMRIGIDNLVWCPLQEDSSAKLTYKQESGADQIYLLPGVMSLNINPNTSIETAYYDDGPGEVASTLGNVEVTLNKSSLGPKEQALLLGASYVKLAANHATAAGLLSGVADTPPWGALGYRTLKSDGTYRYVWLLKGKFTIPTSNNETKGESINFQSDEITGRFVGVNHVFDIKTSDEAWDENAKISPWKVEWDETSEVNLTNRKTIKEQWFNKVVLPTFAVQSQVSE